jgi:hypothetical protein
MCLLFFATLPTSQLQSRFALAYCRNPKGPMWDGWKVNHQSTKLGVATAARGVRSGAKARQCGWIGHSSRVECAGNGAQC